MTDKWRYLDDKCYDCEAYQEEIKRLKIEIDILKDVKKPQVPKKKKKSNICGFAGSQRFICLRCSRNGDKSLTKCTPDLDNVF